MAMTMPNTMFEMNEFGFTHKQFIASRPLQVSHGRTKLHECYVVASIEGLLPISRTFYLHIFRFVCYIYRLL